MFINGLNPDVFMEWVDLIGLARDRSALNHFNALSKLFHAGHFSKRLYAFNITTGRYEYLDGTLLDQRSQIIQ